MNYLFYIIGIFILTFGVAATILSDLGTSPFDAFLVGLTKKMGLTVGSWEVLLSILLIGCNALFKWQLPEVLGMVTENHRLAGYSRL